MQRPRILNLVTSWLVAEQSTPFHAATPLVGCGLDDVAGRAFETSEPGALPIAYLTTIVRSYENDAAAVSATRALLADAGDLRGTLGVAVVNRRQRPLPGDRGGVVTWGIVRGFDADRSAWATAVTRRGHVVWDVTATGFGIAQLERTVIDIAGSVCRRPGTDWGLWDLLPGVDDLPGPMRVDAVFTFANQRAIAA